MEKEIVFQKLLEAALQIATVLAVRVDDAKENGEEAVLIDTSLVKAQELLAAINEARQYKDF